MKLSVIVPCYNSSKSVCATVESILANNLDDMEILLINDGSLDNTLSILKDLERKYKNVRVLNHKKNRGLSGARNTGIKESRGKYLSFIDAGDTIEPKMYKTMLEKAKMGFDVVVCGENRIFPTHIQKVMSGVEKDCENKEDIKKIMCSIYPSACNKIYKSSIFENICFKEGVLFEDVEFLYRFLPFIDSIGVVEECFYNYYQTPGSITHTFDSRLYDFISNWNGLLDFYKENNLFETYYYELEFCYIRYLFATFIKRLVKMKDRKEFKKGVARVKKEVKIHFPNYKRNPYLKGKKGLYLKYFGNIVANIVFLVESVR